ncbi:MAG: 2Fe-2S iron-sulfur cluster binding domain-containing protein, partial [Actinobacteria bacterium]|nr:2Fe-2S iron-sulfur cluster binding domain-containing protein [Actinomycetota bacterium]
MRCRFLPEDREIEADSGATILDAAQANDIPVETVCAGKGTCGTCRILIRAVATPAPNPHDRRRLSDQQLAHGWRLACQHTVAAGAAYSHPVGVRAIRVVESAGLGRIRLDPSVQKIYVKPKAPSLHDQRSDWARIQDELAAVAGDVDPALPALLRLAAIGEQITAGLTVVIAGNRIVSFEPGDTTRNAYGFAFDIGTTTVVGALMDLVTGQE